MLSQGRFQLAPHGFRPDIITKLYYLLLPRALGMYAALLPDKQEGTVPSALQCHRLISYRVCGVACMSTHCDINHERLADTQAM
jgi:hypothetical protein